MFYSNFSRLQRICAMFPAVNSQQRQTAGGRSTGKKVPLKPGRSLMDWVRLMKSGKDLKGTGPRLLHITTEELAKHNKQNDIWMALRGMVYNVTEYIEYHPGGADELMRGAGKDATSLFEEVHRWVNYESMLKECLIGKLVESHLPANRGQNRSASMLAPPPPSATSLNPLGVNTMKIDSLRVSNSKVPQIELQDYNPGTSNSEVSVQLVTPPFLPEPSYDWYQAEKTIVFIIYTKCSELERHQIVCDIEEHKKIFVDIFIKGILHTFNISLQNEVCESVSVNVTKSGIAQITLIKEDSGICWREIGSIKHSKVPFLKLKFSEMRFVDCTVQRKEYLTHDTSLYHMKLPSSRWMQVPIGYHVYIQSSVEDVEMCKPYTPVLKSLLNEDAESLHNNGQELYLAIKHYSAGALTSTLNSIKAGDNISISTYDGEFDFANTNKFQTAIMLAAGTGITPMVRVLYSIMHDQSDKQVHLVFFNKEEKDIIFREEFSTMQDNFKGRFFVENVLSRPSGSWSGKSGRISKTLMTDYLEKHQIINKEEVFFFVCGPGEFTKLGTTIVKELGFKNMHAFE